MNENISKPISVVRVEFINKITDLINNSGLPPFVIEPILKEMYDDVKNVTIRQYKNDLEEYQKRLDEQ